MSSFNPGDLPREVLPFFLRVSHASAQVVQELAPVLVAPDLRPVAEVAVPVRFVDVQKAHIRADLVWPQRRDSVARKFR